MSKTYSGIVGFALLPEEAIAKQATQLAMEIVPTAEYTVYLGGAHITLYQAELQDTPETEVIILLETLRTLLKDEVIQLDQIRPYPRNTEWLFWELATISETLRQAHKVSLGLSQWLKKDSQAPIPSEETLAERNTRLYGTELVGELWVPHITLAHDEACVPSVSSRPIRATSSIRVAFVQSGQHGKIDKILL